MIAYLGASQAGVLVVNAAGKISVLLPHTPARSPGPPTSRADRGSEEDRQDPGRALEPPRGAVLGSEAVTKGKGRSFDAPA